MYPDSEMFRLSEKSFMQLLSPVHSLHNYNNLVLHFSHYSAISGTGDLTKGRIVEGFGSITTSGNIITTGFGNISCAGTLTTKNLNFSVNGVFTVESDVTLGHNASSTITFLGDIVFDTILGDNKDITLAIPEATSKRTISVPDASGTIVVSSADRFLSISSAGSISFNELAIQGTGALTSGSIGDGFGSITTGGGVATTGGSGITCDGTLTASGPLVASAGVALGSVASDEVLVKGALQFEGPSLDGVKTVLSVADPTASRTVVLPDSSGTLVVSASDPFLSISAAGDMTFRQGSVTGVGVLSSGSISSGFGPITSGSAIATTGGASVTSSGELVAESSLRVGGSSSEGGGSGTKSAVVQSSDSTATLGVKALASGQAATVEVMSGAGADAKIALGVSLGETFTLVNDASGRRFSVHDGSDLLTLAASTGDAVLRGSLTITGGPVLSSTGIANAGTVSGISTVEASGSVSVVNGPVLTSSGIGAASAVSGVTSLTLVSGPVLSATGIASAGAVSGATTVSASSSVGVSGGPSLTPSGVLNAKAIS